MIEFLNLGSLLLGLFAWLVPIVGILRRNKTTAKSRVLYPILSIGACAVSLWLQIAQMNQRVIVQDWAALMDTCWAVVQVAALLVICTIVLNVMLWVVVGKQPPG